MIRLLRQSWIWLKTFLWPSPLYSWKTIIYMSLFSWLMALLSRHLGASGLTVGIMGTLGWVLLALGVGWFLEANRIKPLGLSIAPWVAGGILCLFLSASWGDRGLQPALVIWPLVSFLVVAMPNLVTWDLKLQRPLPAIRQKLVLLFFLSLLFSSWFLFYFRIQTWLQIYPSLAADRFDQSNFIYRIPSQSVPLSMGVHHLTAAEALIREQVDGQPWSSVERWLLNTEGHQRALQQEIQRTQPTPQEVQLWQLTLQPIANGEGYTLKLKAIWTGPAADEQGYYLEKSCQVMPITRPSESDTPNLEVAPLTRWAQFNCDLATPRVSGATQGVN